MKKTVICFDLDGTLLNTDELIFHSFRHVFKLYKPEYTLSLVELLLFLGPTLEESFSRYFDESLLDELVECYRVYNHDHHKDYVTMYETVEETLHTLQEKGYPMCVVTTKRNDAARVGLDLFHLTHYFEDVIGCDDVEYVKPNPEGILQARNKTKCVNAVMIGDNKTDIQSGKNANAYTIGVKWSPKGTSEMEALKPDLMINKMEEIIPFIERIK